MLIALVLLFGAGYIWQLVPASATGNALVINRTMALMYLFFGELALIATFWPL
jgi:hypothetical protein